MDNIGFMDNFMGTSASDSNNLFGIPQRTLLLIMVVVIVAWLLTNRVERFQVLTDDEYSQDVRNVASYVGPYIGEIYIYLRAKYHAFDPSGGPNFKPNAIDDPTLSDPLLPIARTQIKAWIDSSRLRAKNKYGDVFIDRMKPTWNLDYTQMEQGILQVNYTENGRRSVYFV